jgi:hypothetical protein
MKWLTIKLQRVTLSEPQKSICVSLYVAKRSENKQKTFLSDGYAIINLYTTEPAPQARGRYHKKTPLVFSLFHIRLAAPDPPGLPDGLVSNQKSQFW